MNNPNISVKEIIGSFRSWKGTFKILWHIDKTSLIFISLLTTVMGGIPPAILLANKKLINSVQLGMDKGFQIIIYAACLLVLLYIIQICVNQLRNLFDGKFEKKLNYRISEIIMEKSSKLSMSDFENPEIYDQLQRVKNESGHRPYSAFTQILSIIEKSIILVLTALILILWKWWILFILIFVPLLSSITFFKLGKLEFNIMWERATRQRRLWYYSHLLTNDTNVKEIKLSNLSNNLLSRYKKIYSDFFNADEKIINKRVRASIFFDILNQIFLGFLMFYIVFTAFIGNILIGTMVTYIQALSKTQKSFQGLLQEFFSIYENNLYMMLLLDFLDLKEVEKVYENEKRQLKCIETIEFKNVYFKYPRTDHYALYDVSFKIQKEDIIAMVGQNGSGKSSVIKLLSRLYFHYEGSILINKIPIEYFSVSSIRGRIGVLFQDFIKYELTARENIGFGNINHMDDESIVDTTKKVGSYQLIDELPNKLNTQLGRLFKRGYQLSGGEWQKVAITRSVYKHADCFILDEPSAALDPFSEMRIFDSFYSMIDNKIGIYISHRFTTVKKATNILVFENGTIIEEGTHSSLMKKRGSYYEIYQLQASAYKSDEKVNKVSN